jgi:4-diphosphocytidyl-2-C-methyl-D-erythritol kinase
VNRAPAAAKLNLALVVGDLREDGRHELTTVYQRIDLCDRISLAPAPSLRVSGFARDTLVRSALELLAGAARTEPRWEARIWKRIPVAAGLGGGSSDAATALRLANEALEEALDPSRLQQLAFELGADVPFFLTSGPQLGEGAGEALAPLELPQDYFVLLVLPQSERKNGTADVYQRFDERKGARGYDSRRDELLSALAEVKRPRDLASLPPNDLASSPLAEELRRLGAFRADVSGAGPAVYGLFQRRSHARAAASAMRRHGRTWVTVPAWYG